MLKSLSKNNRFIFIFVILSYAIFTAFILNTGKSILILLCISIPASLIAFSFINITTIILISLFFSSLTFPNFPDRFNLFYGALFIYLFISIFKSNILRISTKKEEINYHIFLIILLTIILLTMAVRGFGIQYFGGDKIGGFAYFQIISTALMIFAFERLLLTPKQWKIALLMMCILGMLPLLTEIVIKLNFLSLKFLHQIKSFIWLEDSNIDYLINLNSLFDMRIRSALNAGILFFIASLIKMRYNDSQNKIKISVAIIIALFIAGISGFRSSIIILIGYFVLFLYLEDHIKWKKLIYLTFASICFISLLFFIQEMPLPVQRAFSWIPFIEISYTAKKSASDTTFWRLTVWKYALQEVLKYIWIGKGLSFSPNSNLSFLVSDQFASTIKTINYHNGPLSVLITLGLGGLITILAFIYHVVKRHYLLLRSKWNDFDLRKYHLIIFTFLVIHFGYFILIFGETNISLPRFFFLTAILEGLVSSDSKIYYKNG